MIVTPLQTVEVRDDRDIARVRRAVARESRQLAFRTLARTRLVTAASELARNLLVYGGGGEVSLEGLRDETRLGLRAHFRDRGPGIEDLDQALSDGYSSGNGLGLGLGGARRLVDQFEVEEPDDGGTLVTITSWRQQIPP